jgi:hypothetical protein
MLRAGNSEHRSGTTRGLVAPRTAVWQWAAAAGFALLLGVLLYLRSDIYEHNQYLAALQRSLAALPLPPGARRIQAYGRVGLLAGNGNHCDYLAAELCATTSDAETVLRHYGEMSIPAPNGRGTFKIHATILGGSQPPDSDLALWPELDTTGAPGELRYAIYVVLIGHHDAGFDPRCH